LRELFVDASKLGNIKQQAISERDYEVQLKTVAQATNANECRLQNNKNCLRD
jgi:hypothetical protein